MILARVARFIVSVNQVSPGFRGHYSSCFMLKVWWKTQKVLGARVKWCPSLLI
ncbi:MAG: hypothetical protein CM15mP74_19140 [Halieaceae bacterium]|nr:MAG: hypothetical protein CM15mP74_19140 [Halieaceae bacterium]